MSYHYNLPQMQISIKNEDIKLIIDIVDKLLAKHTKITVIGKEEFQKSGIWYSLIIKKVEDITGDKFGSSLKILPEIQIKLDSFAHSLIERFDAYMTQLLKIQKIDSEKIISEIITDKFVLIREILRRLLGHAISADRTHHQEGECLLKVTKELIKELNSKELLFTKSTLGKIETTEFGVSLTRGMDYWIKLIGNSVKVTDLIHKNTHACTNCFQLLKNLKLMTLRQIAVLLDPSKDVADYHDDLLVITMSTIFKEKKLEGLTGILGNSDGHESVTKTLLFTESSALSLIDTILQHPALTTNKHKEVIKKRLEFFIKLQGGEYCLDKMSIIMTTLGWFPVITGTLELSGFCGYLSEISEQAIEVLDANLIDGIVDEGKVRLMKYNSMSVGDISLASGFEIVTKQLNDLSNPETIAQLLKLIGYTAIDLIALQKEMKIVVINEQKLISTCQLLTGNTPGKPTPSNIASSSHAKLVLTHFNSSNSNLSVPSATNFYHPKQLTTSSNDNSSSYPAQISQGLPSTTTTTSTLAPSTTMSTQSITSNTNNICIVQRENQAISQANTYVVTQNNKHWQFNYYHSPTGSGKLIEINAVKGLQQQLSSIHNLTDENIQQISELIYIYHIKEYLTRCINESKNEEGLEYLKLHQGFISKNTWLTAYAFLCKAQFHFKLAQQNVASLINQPHDSSTIFIVKQAIELKKEIHQNESQVKEWSTEFFQNNLDEDKQKCILS